MEILDHIFVFKTNIKTHFDKARVAKCLDGVDAIEEWSVDIEDIDCVLRIVSVNANMNDIIVKIKETGFECSELE